MKPLSVRRVTSDPHPIPVPVPVPIFIGSECPRVAYPEGSSGCRMRTSGGVEARPVAVCSPGLRTCEEPLQAPRRGPPPLPDSDPPAPHVPLPRHPAYPRGVLLSDKDIRAEIHAGRVRIDPYDDAMMQPSSIDVRLDRYFRVFENHRYPHIDPSVEQTDLTRLVEPAGDEPFILHPGEFVLASTYEAITLPDDLSSRLEGKSSLGRLGLVTHSTAGFIDPGFSGHVTLELSNLATLPIKLWPGMKIGQLCMFRLTSPAEFPYGSDRYGSRYQGQRGPTASRSYLNFHRTQV